MMLKLTLLLKLALRNLVRNRTRTLLNLTMVIGAFVSIVFFKGFANYMLWAMEDQITHGQSGHIQVASSEIWSGDLPKKKEQAYVDDVEGLQAEIAKLPYVERVSGRANVPVLLSNGDNTVGAIAQGFDPIVESNVEKALLLMEGQGFSKTSEFEVLVSAGLQSNLRLKVGQSLSIVSQSLSGSMSSLDLEVRGIVRSGFTDVDNSTVYIPLKAAQSLLETKRVERLAIVLKPDISLESAVGGVRKTVAGSSQPNLQVKDWKETNVLFRQVSDFYAVQNGVVEAILVVLVFFGILNTIGMSVYERIGEIGTMRALGDRRSEVLSLLACEGLCLGLIGVLLGAPMTALMAKIFSAMDIQMIMPGASMPVTIQVTPHAADYVSSGIAVILTCFISTLWPAQKAVRLSITDALRANS